MKKTMLAIAAAVALSASPGLALAQGVPGSIFQSGQPHPQIAQVYQGDSGPYAWLLLQFNGGPAKSAFAKGTQPAAHPSYAEANNRG